MGDEDGKTQNTQTEGGGAQDGAQGGTQDQGQQQGQENLPVAADYEAQLAERDAQIAALRDQVAAAAKSEERADELAAQIEQLRTEAATERTIHQLEMAGCRNTKAARALLEDYESVDALKAAEPWLFAEPKHARQHGTTGLPPKGTSVNDDDLKRWRKIAGLED